MKKLLYMVIKYKLYVNKYIHGIFNVVMYDIRITESCSNCISSTYTIPSIEKIRSWLFLSRF